MQRQTLAPVMWCRDGKIQVSTPAMPHFRLLSLTPPRPQVNPNLGLHDPLSISHRKSSLRHYTNTRFTLGGFLGLGIGTALYVGYGAPPGISCGGRDGRFGPLGGGFFFDLAVELLDVDDEP